jgi:hypothetical protein
LLKADCCEAALQRLISVLSLRQQQYLTCMDFSQQRSELLQQKGDQQFCRFFKHQRWCQPAAGVGAGDCCCTEHSIFAADSSKPLSCRWRSVQKFGGELLTFRGLRCSLQNPVQGPRAVHGYCPSSRRSCSSSDSTDAGGTGRLKAAEICSSTPVENRSASR